MAESKNPNWKGGTANEPYPLEWNRANSDAVARDGGRCRNPLCRHTSTTINVHHIDYDKRNCRMENLITVCASCNARANFNREWWLEFYRNVLRDPVAPWWHNRQLTEGL